MQYYCGKKRKQCYCNILPYTEILEPSNMFQCCIYDKFIIWIRESSYIRVDEWLCAKKIKQLGQNQKKARSQQSPIQLQTTNTFHLYILYIKYFERLFSSVKLLSSSFRKSMFYVPISSNSDSIECHSDAECSADENCTCFYSLLRD